MTLIEGWEMAFMAGRDFLASTAFLGGCGLGRKPFASSSSVRCKHNQSIAISCNLSSLVFFWLDVDSLFSSDDFFSWSPSVAAAEAVRAEMQQEINLMHAENLRVQEENRRAQEQARQAQEQMQQNMQNMMLQNQQSQQQVQQSPQLNLQL